MTPERFDRFDRALAQAGCDAYVSTSSADLHYLTGTEDGNAFFVYQPGRSPLIVVRPGGYNCALDTARAGDVRSFSLIEGPLPTLVSVLTERRPRRLAVGPLGRDVAEALQHGLDGIDFVPAPRLGRDLRRVKEADEIALLEAAARCVGAGIEACFNAVRPGASDRYAAAAAVAAARDAGADHVTFVQVKAGPRAAYPDAEEVGRRFETGEVGFVDMGVVHRFYRGDYTRAFVVGQPPEAALRIVETVDRIQREALAMLRPGLACRDFYNAVRERFAEAGYPEAIPHHLGHGLGIGDDTLPSIVPTSDDVFLEGEVVCVEPGAYVRGVGGARIEDTVVVQASGNRVLTHAKRIGYCSR